MGRPFWIHMLTMCLGFCLLFLYFQLSLSSLWAYEFIIEKGQLHPTLEMFLLIVLLWPLIWLRLNPSKVRVKYASLLLPILSPPSTSVEKSELIVSTLKGALSCFKKKDNSYYVQKLRLSQNYFSMVWVLIVLYTFPSFLVACGGMFNFSTGIIRSPAYSYSAYPNDVYCLYNITVRGDKVILLKYVGQIHLLKKIKIKIKI